MTDVQNPFQTKPLKLDLQQTRSATRFENVGFIERNGLFIVDDPKAGRSATDLMSMPISKKEAKK